MSNKKEDYYKTLKVPKNANASQIKKAYYKLARKWHPDKNPDNVEAATEQFKVIGEAYNVLSDDQKRQQYDQFGFDGPKMQSNSGSNYSHHDMDDFMDMNMFGNMGNMGGGFGFGDFSFSRAEELFKETFDEEFNNNNNRQQHQQNQQQQRQRQRPQNNSHNPFQNFMGMGNMGGMMNMGMGSGFDDNDFFSNGFGNMPNMMGNMGNMNGFSQQSFSSNMRMGGGGGRSQSTSVSTITRNGKTVRVKKTTITEPDGTQHTEVEEEVLDGGNQIQYNRNNYQGQLENNNGHGQKRLKGKRQSRF